MASVSAECMEFNVGNSDWTAARCWPFDAVCNGSIYDAQCWLHNQWYVGQGLRCSCMSACSLLQYSIADWLFCSSDGITQSSSKQIYIVLQVACESKVLNPFTADPIKALHFALLVYPTIFNFWRLGALALRTKCQSAQMSKIKNSGLDQCGAEPFKQQQFGTAGAEGVNLQMQFHRWQL